MHACTHTNVERSEWIEAQEEVTVALIMLTACHSAIVCKGTMKLLGQLPTP